MFNHISIRPQNDKDVITIDLMKIQKTIIRFGRTLKIQIDIQLFL